MMVKFHETLSEESVYHRYFSVLKLSQRTAHERLTRICFNDYDREIALVAEGRDTPRSEPHVLGVGRLDKQHGVNEAEFALARQRRLAEPGPWRGIAPTPRACRPRGKLRRITGHILPDNHAMQHICRKIGFKLEHDADSHDFLAEYIL